MRTLIQLSFAIIISFSMVSCGGDSTSSSNSTETSSAKGNSNKPVPTFKMANEKSSPKAEKPRTIQNNNNQKLSNKPQNAGKSMSNKLSAKPSDNPINSDRQILNSVPNACSLVSVDDIAKIFGISPSVIKQKDASHTKSPYTSSCFYRWDGASPNTGILVQVQANPVQEEYAEWVSLFVSSKRTTGEKTMGTNETFKYEKMEGLGDDGSYSHRLGKYVWRDGNKYAFMIAFNTNSAKELQMKNAKSIGNIMMRNYKN